MGSEWGAPDKEARIAAHRTPKVSMRQVVKLGWDMYRLLFHFNKRLWFASTLTFTGTLFLCIGLVVLLTGCKGGSPARSAAYAGDGVTKLGSASDGATGKLKWGVTYRAVAQDTTDRQNCKWSLYTINKQGDHQVTVVKRGNYFNAKFRFGQQFTKDVYLKSLECGLWKP